jgi:hypothetical protein
MWVTLVTVAAAAGPSEDRHVEVAARGGGASYAPFQFLTVGGEARVRVVSGLRLLAGAETWGTKRIPPPDYQLDSGVYSTWSWLQPVWAGAVFQLETGPIEPYAGADFVVVNHSADNFSLGGRARLGAHWFFVDHVGVGLDVAAGGWSGQGWTNLADGARNAGAVVQGAAQVVVGF